MDQLILSLFKEQGYFKYYIYLEVTKLHVTVKYSLCYINIAIQKHLDRYYTVYSTVCIKNLTQTRQIKQAKQQVNKAKKIFTQKVYFCDKLYVLQTRRV